MPVQKFNTKGPGKLQDCQEIKAFSIFNRWGKEVFRTAHGMQGWDGSYNGMPAASGTYCYPIELLQCDGTAQILRGEVQLLR